MKKRFPAFFAIILTILIADVVVSALMLYEYNTKLSCILLTATGIIILLFIFAVFFYGRNSLRHLSKMNSHLENSAAEYMISLPAPVAITDENGNCIWYNQIFLEKIALGQDAFGKKIDQYADININSFYNQEDSVINVNGNVYNISSEIFVHDGIILNIVYFHDKTDFYNLKKFTEDTHKTVLIITIDGYNDIIQNAKESEKARISVETEKLIDKFMNGTNGFIKKTSSNYFYAIIDDCHLNNIIEEKFKILDDAREVLIKEKTPLTLSIGVGKGAENLAESEKIARQCLDMALGRGGDQAVVKTENGYQFFGGVSKGVEKKSRSKVRIIANTLQDLIMNCDTVYIMGHHFGDLDSIGSSAGLAGAVKLLGKEVFIAVDEKKNLALQLIDLIRSHSDERLFISPSEAAARISDRDVLIVTDTHNKDFIESKELYNNAKTVVVIDHHRKTVNYIDDAVIFHHEPYASSASEMVTELIQYFQFENDAVLDSCYADALLAGITLDTKNFVMRTGVRTFEAAAFLKRLGADTVSVKMLFSSSIDSYKRKTQIVSSAKIHHECAIAVADFKSDDIRLVAPQAADELLYISGVKASFVAFKTGDTVNISARSLGGMNVQVIMEQLGGGGHQTMAAAQIKDISLQDAVKRLISTISECSKS